MRSRPRASSTSPGSRHEKPLPGRTRLKRIWKVLFYSLDGLAAAFQHEEAFRLEVLLALILVPIALHMPVSGVSKALLMGSLLLVLVAELLNFAIEAVTDRISLEDH